MLEPFHPTTKGVRVPSKVPRYTMCYESFNSTSFTAAQGQTSALYFTNYELLTGSRALMINDDIATQNFLNNPPNIIEVNTAVSATANHADM